MKNQKEFNRALSFVLKGEGFISGEPPDKGGLTIWGISKKSWARQVVEMYDLIQKGKKPEAFEIAENIYYSNYWIGMDCDKLSFPENIVIFDMAVNMGKTRARKTRMKWKYSWKDMLLQRLYDYSTFKQAKIYFRGWANRVLNLWNFILDEKEDEIERESVKSELELLGKFDILEKNNIM